MTPQEHEELAAAVAELGALPMPVGPEPQDPVAAGRSLDLLALMDERAASKVSPVLSGVLDEAERLRARVAELEAPTVFRASSGGRLLGLYRQQEDALSHCEDAAQRDVYRSCPMFWRKRADGTCELFAWTSSEVEGSTGFTVAPVEVRPEFDEGWGQDADEADGISRRIAPTQALPLRGPARLDASAAAVAEATHWGRLGIEDPHDGPLHHDYRVGRDLPELGGA